MENRNNYFHIQVLLILDDNIYDEKHTDYADKIWDTPTAIIN